MIIFNVLNYKGNLLWIHYLLIFTNAWPKVLSIKKAKQFKKF